MMFVDSQRTYLFLDRALSAMATESIVFSLCAGSSVTAVILFARYFVKMLPLPYLRPELICRHLYRPSRLGLLLDDLAADSSIRWG
jgi:hypothetical protein